MTAGPSRELSVPGNLLLLGEYAVLEEGGIGLAAAVGPRVRLEATPSSDLHVEGTWPGGSGESPVISCAVRVVSDYLGDACRGRFRIDSTAFFSAGGRKTGLGSSAAASVALVCGLLAMAGRTDAARSNEAASLAVRAHRLAQGGRGSGYDVLASFHGGWGVVHGGTAPSWEPWDPPGGLAFMTFAGPAPVSTADSVGRYTQWKAEHPDAALEFLQSYREAISSFLAAASAEERSRGWSRCRQLGITLGRAIGVPAEIEVPAGLDARWCKALGAGNELGVCLLASEAAVVPTAAGARRLEPAEVGVRWEP